MKKITIIGSGSWGVALAIHLAKLGHKIKIWSFSKEEADLINNEKKCKFLPKVTLPEGITCYLDYKEAIEGSEIILHVTPSKFTRSTVSEYKKYVTNQPIIICSKGFEKETLLPLDEVIKQEMPEAKIGVLSGPSHAEEVSIGIPTVMVIASKDDELLFDIQNAFMSPEFRIYTSHDVRGVEIGGAFKNIIAFCAGVAAGINLGDNSFAALITRGLGEITRLGVALGGEKDTLYGLSGLGDLIVTCLSEHSRNRKAGKLIGEGKTIEEARKEVGMVIESIDNIEAAYELSKIHNIEMPIVEGVYDILYNNLDPKEAVTMLMTRDRNLSKGEMSMDFFDKLSKKASETYKVTAEKTTKIAKETKLKLEISNYKSNMEDLYKIVGKKIYQKYAAQEEMQLEDIQDELNKLDTISEKIDIANKEIMSLKDKIKCQNCNYEMSEEYEYCPKCGTKIK